MEKGVLVELGVMCRAEPSASARVSYLVSPARSGQRILFPARICLLQCAQLGGVNGPSTWQSHYSGDSFISWISGDSIRPSSPLDHNYSSHSRKTCTRTQSCSCKSASSSGNMEYLTYIRNKALAIFVRYVVARDLGTIQTHQDEVIHILSRDAGRTIKAHLYHSKTAKPTPIILNFHGSGFIIPMHGTDDEFACRIAKDTDYAVLDVSYRLGPEYPHPAAPNDVEDAVKWVLSQPGEFDLSRVAISGFSAGANMALIAASVFFPKGTFSQVIAVYPPTDLDKDSNLKIAPDQNGKPLPAWMTNVFHKCYLPAPIDLKGPTVSPSYTEADKFPDHLVFITCARDNLCVEAEELVAKIRAVPGKSVVHRGMEECDHGWNLKYEKGSVQERAKDEAYDLIVEALGSRTESK